MCSMTSMTSIPRSTPVVAEAQKMKPRNSCKEQMRIIKGPMASTYTDDGTRLKRAGKEHVEEYFGELTVREGKGPQAQV